MRIALGTVVGLFCWLLPVTALGASEYMTDKQFINRGVDAVIAEITAVQVQASTPTLESGTVQLKVLSVIAGTVSTPTISLDYTRVLEPTDEPSNWDMLAPQYVSLSEIGRGRSVLLYLTGSNAVYSLAAAGNAVQDANTGVLLGTMKPVEHPDEDLHRGCRQIELTVAEVIYGWVGGASTISLCVDRNSFAQGNSLPAGGPSPSGSRPAGIVAADTASGSQNSANQQIFIFYNKDHVQSIQTATSTQLTQLEQIDSQ